MDNIVWTRHEGHNLQIVMLDQVIPQSLFRIPWGKTDVHIKTNEISPKCSDSNDSQDKKKVWKSQSGGSANRSVSSLLYPIRESSASSSRLDDKQHVCMHGHGHPVTPPKMMARGRGYKKHKCEPFRREPLPRAEATTTARERYKKPSVPKHVYRKPRIKEVPPTPPTPTPPRRMSKPTSLPVKRRRKSSRSCKRRKSRSVSGPSGGARKTLKRKCKRRKRRKNRKCETDTYLPKKRKTKIRKRSRKSSIGLLSPSRRLAGKRKSSRCSGKSRKTKRKVKRKVPKVVVKKKKAKTKKKKTKKKLRFNNVPTLIEPVSRL